MFDHAKCDLSWHEMACRDFKDLSRATVSDKVLHDKKLNVAINLKQFGYQRALHQWFLGFLKKRFHVVLLKVKLCQTCNYHKKYTNQRLENLKKVKRKNIIKF